MIDISNTVIEKSSSTVTSSFYGKKTDYTGHLGKETSNIDVLLEREKQHNKSESWTKLDKTVKLQKLLGFSEKYAREHNLIDSEKKKLAHFF